MTLLEILELLGKYGAPLIITAIVLYAGLRYLNMRLKRLEEKPLPCLERHHFFSVMERALKVTIPQMDIAEPGRALLARDFLRFKVESFSTKMLEFVRRPSLNDFPPEAFSSQISEVLSQCIQDYEERARREGIPEIYLRKFGEWHKQTVDMTLAYIDVLSQCEAQYHQNYERLASVLSWLEVAFQWTFVDAEKTLASLNGELDGVVYKGITIQRMVH